MQYVPTMTITMAYILMIANIWVWRNMTMTACINANNISDQCAATANGINGVTVIITTALPNDVMADAYWPMATAWPMTACQCQPAMCGQPSRNNQCNQPMLCIINQWRRNGVLLLTNAINDVMAGLQWPTDQYQCCLAINIERSLIRNDNGVR